jgi:hypothetical protein
MGSSQNESQREQGPDAHSALKEMLMQRIGGVELCPDEYGSSDRDNDTAPKVFYCAPSITPAEPSIELNPPQAILQSDRISSGRPSVGSRVFRTVARGFIVITMVGAGFSLLSYGDEREKDIVSAWDRSLSWLSSVSRTNSSEGSDVTAEPVAKTVAAEPAVAAEPIAKTVAAEPAVTAEPVSKTVAAEPAVTAEPVPKTVAAEPAVAAEPVAKTVAAEPVSRPSDQKSSQNTALVPEASSIQSAPASVTTGLSSELQHQLETMASDLAIVRRVVERLAARQDQMARDIATLQAPEQKVSQIHHRPVRLRPSGFRENGGGAEYR